MTKVPYRVWNELHSKCLEKSDWGQKVTC